MKIYRVIISLFLAVIAILIPVFSVSHHEDRGWIHELSPRISEGIAVRESSAGSMSIRAYEEGEALFFEETKELSFTLKYGEGWLNCDSYSRFFPGDSRANVVEYTPGVYKYSFTAVKGQSVLLREWTSVAFNASAKELPKLLISASIPFFEIDRDEWVEASFALTLGSKHFESGEYVGSGQVKGRGNSSWLYPKKPYSIKLDSKASLLDIPKTKKYAIIPGYWDSSLMRNYITYKAWQGLVGIDYVPKCEFVDVYLNGEYNGIYTLVERIDIEKSKIDIDEADWDELSGGYLIEKDAVGKLDKSNDLWFDCPYWASMSQDYFVIKSPEPEDPALAEAMRRWLTGYMRRLHNSIMSDDGESYLNYIDTSSWVDFIIVQEVAKNIDGCMKSSCFMYKERNDDRLYMTAPWDFDYAYGRVNWSNRSEEHNDAYDCPNADTPDGFMILNSSNPWMDRLYDTRPEFRSSLMERYALYRYTLIEDMLDLIDEQAAYLSAVQEPNHALWGSDFFAGVNNLKSWLTARIEWLDSEWLTDSINEDSGDITVSLPVLCSAS